MRNWLNRSIDHNLAKMELRTLFYLTAMSLFFYSLLASLPCHFTFVKINDGETTLPLSSIVLVFKDDSIREYEILSEPDGLFVEEGIGNFDKLKNIKVYSGDENPREFWVRNFNLEHDMGSDIMHVKTYYTAIWERIDDNAVEVHRRAAIVGGIVSLIMLIIILTVDDQYYCSLCKHY